MRRYLVVANQTLGGKALAAAVRGCLAQGPCDFHIVVPATHPKDHLTWTEGRAQAIATRRLEAALREFRELGASVDGEVGDASPTLAIGDALRGRPYDEIILSTLPPGPSRWLRMDLPHRVERTYGLPLTHVVGDVEPVPAEAR